MTAITARLAEARLWLARHRGWVGLTLLILALVYPYAVRLYYLSLAIEVLIFAIFAMSLDLLLGYTGLPSFGHAAYFGLGAYVLAYIASRSELALNLTTNLLLTVPSVVLVTALVAMIVGFFALRTSGIYFLMITLAFAQMLFSIAISWSTVTGGSDGLPGVGSPVLGLGPLSYEFSSRESFYYLVLVIFLLSWWLLRRIVASPFGWTLRGIRENEQRMLALGYNTFYYKIASSMIGGVFAGISGMLLVYFFGHAPPDYFYWTMSGQVMIMLIVGGAGTLTGPILGAGVIRLFPTIVSSYTERWETLMGLLFILFVLFAPKGIVGLFRIARREEPLALAGLSEVIKKGGQPTAEGAENQELSTSKRSGLGSNLLDDDSVV